MRNQAAALVCLAALAAPALSQPATTAPAGLANWDAILLAVDADFEQWLQSRQAAPPPVHPAIGQTRLTEANLQRIGQLLAEPIPPAPAEAPPGYVEGEPFRRRLAGLYRVHLLLLPLRYASAEQLNALQPTLAMLLPAATYLPLPQRTAQQQAGGQFDVDALHQHVLRHNILVRFIRTRVPLLRLLAADASGDRAIVDTLIEDIRSGSLTYMDTLDAIRRAVTQLPPERAQRLYDPLRELVGRLGHQRRDFTDPTALQAPSPDQTGPAEFVTQQRHPGTDVAHVVNLLATAARAPAIHVPGESRPEPEDIRGR